MKNLMQRFMTWLMGLSQIMRYFVIALLAHVGLIILLGTIKIVSSLPIIRAQFVPPPLAPAVVEDDDPYAVPGDVEYKGPTLGDGAGTPGKGPGGIPTAAGNLPTEFKAAVSTASAKDVDPSIAEVIGVVSDIGAAVRPQGASGGIAGPTTGLGDAAFGTAGVRGPGGTYGFGHRQGPVRMKLMKGNPKAEQVERAILAALRWLKEHQRPDGTWECGRDVNAITALAVLAFLGHGETPESKEFGNTVNQGLKFLIGCIDADGYVPSKNGYAQGTVTLALAEGYGMTSSVAIKDPLERSVKAILSWQQAPKANPKHVGGWRYSPGDNSSDTSVVGWMIMALKSARLAGISIYEEPFENASKYLWNMYASGEFGYESPGGGHPACTAIGTLCQQFLGHGDDPRLKACLDNIRKDKPEWDKAGQNWLIYKWYYQTQAMFQAGDPYWPTWEPLFRENLCKNQSSDGHWDFPPGTNEKGDVQGALAYPTAMCVLQLEVYYRYLPLYLEMGRGAGHGQPAPGGAIDPKLDSRALNQLK